MRDVVGCPRPDAGQLDQRAAHVVTIGAAVEGDRLVGQRRGQADQGATAGTRHRQGLGVDAGQRGRVGEEMGETGPVGRDAACRARRRSGRRRCGPRDADLLPDARRARRSRHRRPGRARAARASSARAGPSAGSSERWSSTATGSQSASSRRRTRSTAAAVSRRSAEGELCRDEGASPPRRRRRPARAGPCRSRAEDRESGQYHARRRRPRRPGRVEGEEVEEPRRPRTGCARPDACSTSPWAIG